MKKKVLLIGGGTGGHIIPLKSLADEFIDNNYQVEIVVSDSELDKKIINENFAGFIIHFFKTDKIRRYLSLRNLDAPFKILKSVFLAKNLLSKIKPDVVFFKGGFVGFPFLLVLMFSNFKRKIYSHESDMESGKLTKLTKKIADKVFYSFGTNAYPLFFFDKRNSAKITIKKENKSPNLLVFGGSQGAQFINELIENNLESLTKKFNITLITGVNKKINKQNFARFKQIEMVSAKEMNEKINQSDLIVSRAGANSLFEIIAAKKPSLIIPLPSAAKNHQEKNAQYFAQKGLCYIFHQEKNRNFYKTLITCFEDDKLKESLQRSSIRNAAEKIVKEIIRNY